jgi:[ribosomal protein S5]-alanine N-acetyltransferase
VNIRVRLETPRLILEPLEPSHAHTLFEPLQNPVLYRFIPQEPPATLGALVQRYYLLSAGMSPSRHEVWGNWVMRLRGESQYIGLVEATIQSPDTAFLAYVTFENFWRRGYALEAVDALLVHLAENEIVRVVAEVDARNSASQRLLEKLGFIRVSENPNAAFFKGSWSEEYRYELFREKRIRDPQETL